MVAVKWGAHVIVLLNDHNSWSPSCSHYVTNGLLGRASGDGGEALGGLVQVQVHTATLPQLIHILCHASGSPTPPEAPCAPLPIPWVTQPWISSLFNHASLHSPFPQITFRKENHWSVTCPSYIVAMWWCPRNGCHCASGRNCNMRIAASPQMVPTSRTAPHNHCIGRSFGRSDSCSSQRLKS